MSQPPERTSATSRLYVAGLSATIRSKSGVRAVCPSLLTRISYHVGRPWMFDGNTFFPDTGMPMRKIACMMRPFADADPEPLGVAILKAKSLTRSGKGITLPPPTCCTTVSHLHVDEIDRT